MHKIRAAMAFKHKKRTKQTTTSHGNCAYFPLLSHKNANQPQEKIKKHQNKRNKSYIYSNMM